MHERYTTQAYGRAIAYACRKIWPAPQGTAGESLKQWRREHCWSPNQLRHNYATRIHKDFGLEAAQLGLGHARADVTQIYAERDLARLLAIMEQVG